MANSDNFDPELDESVEDIGAIDPDEVEEALVEEEAPEDDVVVPAKKKASAASHKSNPSKAPKGSKRYNESRMAAREAKPTRVKSLESPRWWAPLLLTLMIVGLVIVVAAYIMGGNFPVKGLGNGNLFIGFGFMLIGFLMTLGWK